jgi:hypothetical protein
MNVVLLVVDSLRARSLGQGEQGRPRTPFLDGLSARTVHFPRAYATECWTLPTHCSIFTGLLPSQHRAHFRTMAYAGRAPTAAEVLAAAGYHTEVVTRNFVFDGTIPGITRGFQHNTRRLAAAGRVHPFALLLAVAKPRFRRHVKGTGFFHPLQRDSRRFLATFARALMPADVLTLDYILEAMTRYRRRETPYFLFGNLYDVHAPYPPTPTSILRPFLSAHGCLENLMFPYVMSCLGSHRYLEPGFRLSAASRRMLLGRYHRAIELMDAKLSEFHGAALAAGLLDDTLLIVTSDHGEAFGEHGLYLHDASVYDTHLHVPLWVHHPAVAAGMVDDVVSTRDLFGLITQARHGRGIAGTILDARHRAENPIALAEHFYYPHAPHMAVRYRQDVAAAVVGSRKVIVHREGVVAFDLDRDPNETAPAPTTLDTVEQTVRGDGLSPAAIEGVMHHLRSWQAACEPAPV